jgi:hypothetical protein
LGTVSGGGADRWNTEFGLWSDDNLVGSAQAPFADYKGPAWLHLDLSGAEILIQRRFGGAVKAQTRLATACLFGKTRFFELFTAFDTSLCGRANITVIEPPADSAGLSGSTYRESLGVNGLGGSSTNGWCWNGGDSDTNTFTGHAGWNTTGNNCVEPSHNGYIGVFQSGTYPLTDVSTTNWLNGTDTSQTAISFFAR